MDTQRQTTTRILESHRRRGAIGTDVLSACIDACFACTQACTACADACLAEERLENLRRCIRLDLDCADVCDATARVLSRQSELESDHPLDLVRACASACRACADECGRHADMMEHCRLCAEACRACEKACAEVLAGASH